MTSSTAIEHVAAWEALDSRGTPTVACRVELAGGAHGNAIAPSGASTGRHEAHERRDGGERFGGRGVQDAVTAVATELGPLLAGADAADQVAVDTLLRAADDTPGFRRLGANAALAVSLASAVAAARGRGVELFEHVRREQPPLLPMPMVNIVSGGAHAGRGIDVQDLLVVPVGASSFAEAIEWCWRVRTATATELGRRGGSAALVADEGGLGPVLESNRSALDLLAAGIDASGLRPGLDVAIAIDVAATQLVDGAGYHLSRDGVRCSAAELVEMLAGWCEQLPIVSLEDPLGEDDWDGWADATARLSHLQVLGDDLFVTDRQRLARGIRDSVANAVLVKPNQTGTLTDARQVVEDAVKGGYATVLSARSGDTEDAWLADLAVGWATGQIKVGSVMRSERTAKWNRLLEIEATHDGRVEFAGAHVLAGRRTGQPATSPPSITSSVPVTNVASSDAR